MVEPAVVVTAAPTKASVSLLHRLEYAGLRLALLIARLVPIEWLSATGAGIMRLVGPRLRQNRRALNNLAIAFPERTPAEHAAIARQMWANMGRTFAEVLVLDRLAADPSRIELADRDVWSARANEPGPIVGCTLHLGNWEMTARPIAWLGRSLCGVYKPLDNPLIDAWLIKTRAPLYPYGLLGKGDRDDTSGTGQRTARQLITRARAGAMLCFVCDHFDRRGEPIPFLGRTSRFTTIPMTIARHVGARVWLARCRRIGTSSRFRMEICEIPAPDTGDRKADGLAHTAAIFAQFEAWIRENPEQWMWWNTRWIEPGTTLQPVSSLDSTPPQSTQ